jgi:hypothetical protein
MDEMDALVARVRTDGPVPLSLDGWDQASIWGWDETADSLFAELWRNTDDPAKPPTIRIAADDLMPEITLPETLALHIAMAVDRSPWEVTSAMDEAEDQDEEDGDDEEEDDSEADEGGTDVTMTEGYGLPEWPYRPQLPIRDW